METIFMNTGNSRTNEPHRLRPTLAGKLNLKDRSKHMALVNLSIYYTWKNIKSAYNKNKFKISALTWNENLIRLRDHILFQKFKIILNLSSKNAKL